MSDEFDPMADLGLDDIGTAANAAVTTEGETATEATTEKKKREHIKLGAVVVSEDDEIIPLTRNFSGSVERESKYKFDELAAPRVREDGKTVYGTFFVELPEGVDADKLKRSVQSATTQANSKHATRDADGKVISYEKYFITRSVVVDGVYKGTKVYRTDAPDTE